MNAAKIREATQNSIKAILRGEFLLRLHFDRYFMQILYLFFLVWSLIWTNLEIEQTMLRMEKNKKVIEDLRIYHAQKNCELVSYDRITTIQTLLKQMGSGVDIPEKPADRIRK